MPRKTSLDPDILRARLDLPPQSERRHFVFLHPAEPDASLTVLALHRRGLVEAMPSTGGGPCRAWVLLTAEGREALGEVPVDA